MNAQGWGPEGDCGIDMSRLSLPKGSMIYLRPDDVFQIGHVTLRLQREIFEPEGDSKVQVTSSGYDGATADQLHVHEVGGIKEILEATSNGGHLKSTPRSAHDIDTTIMETPTASRNHIPGLVGSSVMSTAAGNGNKDQGNCQKREQHPKSPDVQASIRESIQGRKEVGLAESIPNTSSEDNDHVSDEFLGETNISNAIVGDSMSEPQKEASNPLAEELTSELPKEDSPVIDEDTQTSTRHRSEKLLYLANSGPPSSPIPELASRKNGDIEAISKRAGNPFNEAADRPAHTPPAVTSRQSSRKRKWVADESQDSMKSMIHVEIPPLSARAKNVKQQFLEGESGKKGSASKQSTKKKATGALRDISEPLSSGESVRSLIREESTIMQSTSTKLRVFFASSTTVDKTSKSLNFLENHGVTKAKSVKDCDILCIGNSDLKKTCNLVLAVISGKQVIIEDWVVKSVTKGELLDHNDFLARDPVKEAEWEIDLSEAIERGKQGVKPFLGFIVHFTPAAKKELGRGFTDLKDIVLHAGAKSVQATLPRKSSLAQAPTTVVVALPDDSDLSALQEGGWRSFNKDIVTLSVLRGSLDVNSDEFLIRHKDGTRNGSRKRMKR